MTNQRLVRVSTKVSSVSVRLLGGDLCEKRSFLRNLLTEEEIRKCEVEIIKAFCFFNSKENVGCDSLTRRFELYLEKPNIQLLEMFDADSNNQVFIEKVWNGWRKPDFILCAPANDKSTEGLQ